MGGARGAEEPRVEAPHQERRRGVRDLRPRRPAPGSAGAAARACMTGPPRRTRARLRSGLGGAACPISTG